MPMLTLFRSKSTPKNGAVSASCPSPTTAYWEPPHGFVLLRELVAGCTNLGN